MTKTFTRYPCNGCGLPVSNAGVAAAAHRRSADHQLGITRNILRKLAEVVPHGCAHVGPYLIESAREAIESASEILDAKAERRQP